MILTYEYRIQPNNHQEALLLQWLELLRRHWNYCLGQRLDWLHRTRCFIDRCSLVSQPIGEIPECPNYYYQSAQLKQTKELFPEYKGIYHEVQQQNLLRLEKAWRRWLFPDATGKRGGRPKFKKAGEFPRVNCPKAGVHLTGQTIKFSKIGEMPIILHRPLPEGFTPKTCTVVQRADGWYVCITLEDKTVPAPAPKDKSEIKNATGIDLGLNSFLVTGLAPAVLWAVREIIGQKTEATEPQAERVCQLSEITREGIQTAFAHQEAKERFSLQGGLSAMPNIRLDRGGRPEHPRAG